MATGNSLSNHTEVVDLPLTMINTKGHRIEFYSKMNSEGTFSLIMLAGFCPGDISKELLQGPFQSRDQLIGAVGFVVEQLLHKGYSLQRNQPLLPRQQQTILLAAEKRIESISYLV